MTNKTPSQTRALTVAIVGNPNTGKSTVFNALTGMRARVGNFPGVTVEKKTGRLRGGEHEIELIDLPGTYSLSPRTPDEMVSVNVLLGRQKDIGTVDAVVCVLDASNLHRNLYLVSQVLDIGLPTVLLLNMWDVVEKRGMTIDADALADHLKVPVVPTIGHRLDNLDQVTATIAEMANHEVTAPLHRPFPPEFYEGCRDVSEVLRGQETNAVPGYLVERLLLDVDGEIESQYSSQCGPALVTRLKEVRDRLAASGLRVPLVEARSRYRWVRQMLDGIVTVPEQSVKTASDRIDGLLTHRLAGMVIFAVLMLLVFQAIYTWSGPVMDLLTLGQGWAAATVRQAMPPGALRSLLIDGVVAGVGGVLIFLPQIALLFLFIAVLEDCGYMARAAFLMDKLMARVGLSGKSFVPLMSCFACAVPGVMATRVIENYRDRMVTILIAPLMSCSARLPIYLLLIAAFIPAETYAGGWVSLQGLVLFAVISLGAIVAVPVAWGLKKTVFHGAASPFVMELPTYKWPSGRVVFHRVLDRCKSFILNAGTLIFAATVLVWAAGYFPGDHSKLDQVTSQLEALRTSDAAPDESDASVVSLTEARNRLGRELVERSFLGRIGRTIEPVVQPLGWDWRIGVGVVASFPAREVIIATLGTIYSLGGEMSEEDEGLKAALHDVRHPDGRKVFNVPVALSIMVFFALCAQCAPTLMVIRREANGWGWAVLTFFYMTSLAYIGALLTYQIGSRFA